MKIIFKTLCIIAFAFISVLQSNAQDSKAIVWKQKANNFNQLSSQFNSPPNFYAPHMFWFWDTNLDSSIIIKQAKDMISKRVNPGYVHARGTYFWNSTLPALPKSEWLSDKWFDCYRSAFDITKNSGYHMSFDSEYMWPSGMAGGKVLEKSPNLQAKTLYYTRQLIWGPWTIQMSQGDFSVLTKVGDKGLITSSTLKIVADKGEKTINVPDGKWVIYTYRPDFHAGYDGGEVNYLDPRTIAEYLEITEKPYLDKFKDDKGKTMGGVYPDHEGDFGWGMAWSEYLPLKFKEQKGYDIKTILPLLTERDEEGKWIKARTDWFEVVSEIYSKDYWGKMSDYNLKHNMYTITNLWESPSMLVMQTVGDIMRLNRYVSMPGIDQLADRYSGVRDYKETQSVSEFEDKPFMCEVLGVLGWQQTPADMKSCTNAATSFGVTHHNPHCITTNRKMEYCQYSADWYTENPYWDYLDQWSDYTRRAAFVTRMTKLNAEILLLNPIESIWAYNEPYFEKMLQPNYFFWDRDPAWNADAKRIDSVYASTMTALEKNNLDFLIGDTYYVNKAQVKNSGEFSINNYTFKMVVVPEMLVMSHSSMDKLLTLAKNNVSIILLSKPAISSTDKGYNDTLLQSKTRKLLSFASVINLSSKPDLSKILPATIKSKITPKITISDTSVALYFAHRTFANKHFYWIANKNETAKNVDFVLSQGEGQAQIWDCESGTIKPVYYEKSKSNIKYTHSLKPYEGFWLVFDSDKKPISKQAIAIKNQPKAESISGLWSIELDSVKKVLVSNGTILNKNNWNTQIKSKTQNKIQSFLGVILNDTNSICIKVPVNATKVNIPIEGITVYADQKVVNANNGEYQLPENANYLFIVKKSQTSNVKITEHIHFLCDKTTEIELSDWSQLGLNQYTGFLSYTKKIQIENQKNQNIVLDLGKVNYMAEVWVNGLWVGKTMFPPFTFDITKSIKNGENTIKVKVGNLYLNEFRLLDDMNMFKYGKEQGTWGMYPKPKFEDFCGGFLGPVTIVKN